MPKIYMKELGTEEPNIEINIEQFSQLIKQLTSMGMEDKSLESDHLMLTLPPGKRCRINPGIAFNILEFDKKTAFPGFVHPIGKGCCDIYSEESAIKIDLYLNVTKDASVGLCANSEGLSTYGPFYSKNEKDPNIDFICYFNQLCNFKDSNSSGYVTNLNPHILFVRGLCVIDFRKDVIGSFASEAHWKEIYKDHLIIKDNELVPNNKFYQSPNDFKIIDVTDFIPKDQQISEFICQTKTGFNQVGSKIKLANGSTSVIPHLSPGNTLMYFSLPKPFLIIPPEVPRKLYYYNFPSHLLANECSGVGVSVNIGVKDVMNALNLLFSQKGSSVEKEKEKLDIKRALNALNQLDDKNSSDDIDTADSYFVKR